jgi:tRNA (guanine37-N1)-methyltransferase
VDAVTRLIRGALGNEDSAVNESFSGEAASGAEAPSKGPAGLSHVNVRPTNPDALHHGLENGGRGILDYPHYTRPQTFRGWDVPEVLVSGNHEEIRRWRHERALEKTRRNRPDLLGG